ncbi:predicted protein [Phaeodactylum tricornutum CCAP 1055/1]|uniref:N-acetyltransferase domain-containing protein n=2 Tax=Phaeodactylum tricornutum TaxID=2850 RepID=B7FVS8_PHATC|nr:predicted protein [Phaeodactylum tricornutum CCAP 1055/1]EEC49682.1 predicted protein [Phaeodactylum tricornutum CCAP 1055/1]|eukprot:XP_002178984.1 predicted protein [Phaeodactylum tricornutum CCAP 1055/1]
MGYTNDGSDDFEKLRKAFKEVTAIFGSFDNLLEAFGLADMPQAQRYGIAFGCLVFLLTVIAVLTLLTLGGTFKRLEEQAQTGDATLLSSRDARAQRALLLERLLEGRERMVRNYPDPPTTEKLTSLTKMLSNVAPQRLDGLSELANESVTEEKKREIRRYFPPHYEENYVDAYRKCQERPGGAVLSGRPEARFEAYARAFAGCGPYTSVSYRRSYGRLYEATSCMNLATDDKYVKLFKYRPNDIIGRYIRLEALEVDRHLEGLYNLTSGDAGLENKSFDPEEIWGFLEDGPFEDAKAMRNSFIFMHLMNEAAFAIVNNITDKLMGCILLSKDDPQNLTIQLEPPLMQPTQEGSRELLESCFLLMDRLFAYGYRRLQISIDALDSDKRKLAMRLGFTLEGVLYKHMVVKESSRDSNIYGLLNSDWKRGARVAIFKELYGDAAFRVDSMNEKKEEEFDEQTRVLKEQKRTEQENALLIRNKKV